MIQISKKKLLAVFCTAVLLGSLLPVQTILAAEPDYTLGDVNDDGVINSLDAQLLLKGGLTEIGRLAGDVNQDNQANETDAQLILDYAAGKSVSFTKASITLNKSTLSLNKGSSATLTAAIQHANSSVVNWESSSTDIATVSSDGTVTAVRAGSTTITAVLFNGAIATCTVVVTAPSKSQYFGIDVSKWNGNINWADVADSDFYNVDGNSNQKLSDSVDFAIIRVGHNYRNNNVRDEKFTYNYNQAKKYDIPVGSYYVLYTLTVEGAKKEAVLCKNLLQGYDLDYPIFYDIEDFDDEYDISGIPKQQLTDMVLAFCDAMESYGYYAAPYSGQYFLQNELYADQLSSKYDIWVAQYPNGGYTTNGSNYKGQHSMWQFASNGSIDGISGNVDLNVSYVDFASKIRTQNLNRAERNTAKASVTSGAAGTIYANDLIK